MLLHCDKCEKLIMLKKHELTFTKPIPSVVIWFLISVTLAIVPSTSFNLFDIPSNVGCTSSYVRLSMKQWRRFQALQTNWLYIWVHSNKWVFGQRKGKYPFHTIMHPNDECSVIIVNNIESYRIHFRSPVVKTFTTQLAIRVSTFTENIT